MGLNLLDVFAASVFDRSKQEVDSKGDWRCNCGWAGKFILKSVFEVVLVICD